jgi:hypothetical protein
VKCATQALRLEQNRSESRPPSSGASWRNSDSDAEQKRSRSRAMSTSFLGHPGAALTSQFARDKSSLVISLPAGGRNFERVQRGLARAAGRRCE